MIKSTVSQFIPMAIIFIVLLTSGINRSTSTKTIEADTQFPRQGSAWLTFTDQTGSPLQELTVQYQQTTHDFLFGVGMTSPNGSIPINIFSDLAKNGLNYALPFMAWGMIEPNEGVYTWGNADNYSHIPEVKQLGFTLNGHVMLFFINQPEDVPTYIRSMGFTQLKDVVYEHVFAVVSHYKGIISYWTLNEPTFEYSDFFKLSSSQWVEVIDAASRAIRKADPHAKIMINLPPRDLPKIDYYPLKFLDSLQSQGVEFDLIGIELYPAFFDEQELDQNGYPDISWVSSRLDEFAQFNKPIILSEVGVSDKPSPQAQAFWLQEFYSMAFNKLSVAGITWYFVDDDPFMPGGGLYPNFNSPPRPVYQALTSFIQDETTMGTITTDANGTAIIKGYAGNYLIQVDDTKGLVSFTIHITEREDSAFAVEINGQNQITLVPQTPTPWPTETLLPTTTQTPTQTSTPTITSIPTLPPPMATSTTSPVKLTSSIQEWIWPLVGIIIIVTISLVFGIFHLVRRRRQRER